MHQQVKNFLERMPHELKGLRDALDWTHILYALLLTLCLFIVLQLVRAGRLFVERRVEQHRHKVIKPIQYRGFTLVQAQVVEKIIKTVSRLLVNVAYCVLLYAYVSVLFSLFKATEQFAGFLVHFLVDILHSLWVGFTKYFPNLVSIFIICTIGYYAIKLLKGVFKALEDGRLSFDGFYQEWINPTYSLIKFLIILLILVLIFPLLPGADSPAFQGISVFLGVLLSLGSSSAVGNVIAGIVLTYTRSFRIGDCIETNSIMGFVVHKSLLVTQIRTIKNVVVTVPNSLVLGALTQNYSQEARQTGLILHTSVTIGYDAPWRQVHALLLQAAGNTPGILREPASFVLQTSLDDFYVSYELNAYTRDANRIAGIYSDLHQNIQDSFNKAGVEIMSPHYRALRDGNQSTVVPES